MMVEHWQGCFGFRQEAFRNYLIVRIQRPWADRNRPQAVYRAFGSGLRCDRRQKIPEIVARPRGPWETMVDVERTTRQGPTASRTQYSVFESISRTACSRATFTSRPGSDQVNAVTIFVLQKLRPCLLA